MEWSGTEEISVASCCVQVLWIHLISSENKPGVGGAEEFWHGGRWEPRGVLSFYNGSWDLAFVLLMVLSVS